jgi:hypothetical protein
MADIHKKGGPDLEKLAQTDVARAAPARPTNVFAKHGNQQITDVVQQAQAAQKGETQFLQGLSTAQQAEAEQTWWQDEEVARKSGTDREEDEESQIAKKSAAEEDDKRAAKKDADRGRKLSPQEEMEQLKAKSAAISAGALEDREKALLKDADKRGLDDQDKAAMLIRSGDVDQDVVKDQTGGVQSLMAAEQMPSAMAAINRDASADAAKKPLTERQTIRNVTDELRLMSKQIGNYPALNDPNLSIESKATQLVDLLASQLDPNTRESVSSYAYTGITEDLIFDPQAILEINTVAGSNRDVRTIGGFSMVLWQVCVDAVRGQLSTLDKKDQVNEADLWQTQLRRVAGDMYMEAMAKPTGT